MGYGVHWELAAEEKFLRQIFKLKLNRANCLPRTWVSGAGFFLEATMSSNVGGH
jgi:hypothetical protein